MSTRVPYFSILFTALTLLISQPLQSQEKLSWLDDFDSEMLIGSDTYQYNFTQVESNACKLRFEELHTDKKGNKEKRSWIFYLSDIDPDALSFKAKGKALNISMETFRSQKFISYYEEGELDGYTEEIKITMNEVDMARSFLSVMKEKITGCKETQATWENKDQALAWLINNVGKTTDEEIEWDQKFQQGSKDYLVDFLASSVNQKGEEESLRYLFDLSDMDPSGINLKISGTTLTVEAPVKEGKRYIQIESSSGTMFANEVPIYANDIESARQIVHALSYAVSHTIPERPKWDSYSAALAFVKDNLGEVKVDDDLFTNSIHYDTSPSGLVDFKIGKSESGGSAESVTYSFYLTDIKDKLKFEVSKYGITIKMDTKDDRDFIRKTKDGKVTGYSSDLDFRTADIDVARDILNAFEHAIGSSVERIEEFNSISEISSWFTDNIDLIEIDGDTYAQKLNIMEDIENQLVIERKLTEADGESAETSYILYPEDISLDDLDIKVSGRKLYVPLETENGKYIKKIDNGVHQNFTGITEILFFDPLAAKNFVAAIRFLKENSGVEERATMSRKEAMAFLSGNIQNIDLPDDQYEQKLEVGEGEDCKMSFTRVETDSKGGSDEYRYEFHVSDIHAGSSSFSVKGKLIIINLETQGNEKLIKPYENGEADDFEDNFIIYSDDILMAKKILAALASLSEGCK